MEVILNFLSFLFLINLFILAVLGLHFRARAFSSCGKRGSLFIAVCGPLLLRSTGSRRAGSVVVAHGPSCSPACGIFPDQGSNPCPLHWQADPQPLRHQGSPILYFLIKINLPSNLHLSPASIFLSFIVTFLKRILSYMMKLF